jgi:threonine/homoserine/homoserine lactone efflux protein
MSAGVTTTFEAALVLSLAYTLIPGPTTVEALRRGAEHGARAVVLVRLGSMGGSLLWGAAVLTGAGMAMRNPESHIALSAAGSALLLLLVWRAMQRAQHAGSGSAPGGAWRGSLLTGAALGAANPLAAAFWLGADSAVLGSTTTATPTAVSAFIAGFIVAHLLVTALLAVLVGCGRSVGGGGWLRMANLACVVPLAWFAVSPLLRAM